MHPGSLEHSAILSRIPGDIQSHWSEILSARGSEAIRILESTRNRLDPFFESTNLRRMFGSTRSLFDCERFIKERKIVVLNLGKYGRIPGFIADTIGSLALNEIFETASRLSTEEGKQVVDPTYVIMDEFQKYVSVDIEDALPTVRQMGLRLFLAHQSFSQLEREDVDLTQMIWQARSRLMFANNANDADIIAEELARLTFDPKRIKDIRTSKKQLITGYRTIWLESESNTNTQSTADIEQKATGYQQSSDTSTRSDLREITRSTNEGETRSTSQGQTNASSSANTSGRSQASQPIHETFEEVSSITYESFEEQALLWGKEIRRLQTGEAFIQLANDPEIHFAKIDHLPIHDSLELRDRIEELIVKNFESEFFISAAEADRELELYRHQLLQESPIVLPVVLPDSAISIESEETASEAKSDSDPFR